MGQNSAFFQARVPRWLQKGSLMPKYFLSTIALLIICVVVTPTEISADEPTQATKPNVLFIAIDDQNDWIGCLNGHPQIQTPNIDRLADQGTVFLNAHCQSPLCNSSRTSLMTGRRPSSTGIYGLAPWFRNLPEFKDVVSLPQHMRNNGYKTLTAGKIYHGGYGRKPKRDNEFDVIGPPPGVGARPAKKLVETPSDNPLVDWGVFPHQDEDKQDYVVASWAVQQLEQKVDEPFFLSVGFFLPHVPCYATQKWFDLYPEDTLQLPPFLANDRQDTPRYSWYMHWKLPEPRHQFLVEQNQWKNLVRSYLACTSFVDSQVGRVLAALENSPHADNTVVVLWSDHGWHLGEKQITGKNTLWDRSTRVPLIFAGPGVASGGRCEQPAELLDIYPTLADLCGLPQTPGLEGHTLMPQLKDADANREWPAITTHNHDSHGIRSKNYRFIQYADGSEELYDMKADPNEWNNLAYEEGHDAVLAEHRKWIPESRLPAEGSRSRILVRDPDTTVDWEGTKVTVNDPIPELNDEAQKTAHRTDRRRVLLLGDSISIGYTPFVQAAMKKHTDVMRPMSSRTRPENCAGTTHGINRIDDWLQIGDGNFDVIHFNWGLHDLKRVNAKTKRNSNNPSDPYQASPEDYEKQLREIVGKLKKTSAKLIFATTTPVPEGGVKPHRAPADVETYNKVARKIMQENGIAVNDLYSAIEPKLKTMQRPVNVHFSPAGSKFLAEKVVNALEAALK